MRSYLTLSYSLVYLTSAVAEEAFLAIDYLVPVESLISFWRLLTTFFRSLRFYSNFLISASIYFFFP